MGGRISLVGVLSGNITSNIATLIGRYLSVHALLIGSRAHFKAMNRALAANSLLHVIDRVFDSDDALQAYRYLQVRGHFGKVVTSTTISNAERGG
jgi:NADPH:quinone reductase-like Zn-dependent oxidoreductase